MREPSYELKVAPAPPMPRGDYAAAAAAALRQLLDSGECDESAYQSLLERYPILVPGVHPTIPVGHNGIFPIGVITQPVLSGLASQRPDFCVVSYTSGMLYATFVEIESPCKAWSTQGGQATTLLTQALQQLRDWSIWFGDGLNSRRFLDEYRIPEDVTKGRDFTQHYVLIYGRRKELNDSGFAKRRNRLAHANETLMTWDRVSPQPYDSEVFTVRLTADGYRAVTVPPTLTVGPHTAREHALILDRDAAIDRALDIPQERRTFLKERWRYWDGWAATESSGVVYNTKQLFDAE